MTARALPRALPGIGAILVASFPAAFAAGAPLSFAFASQAGTGIYEVEGRTVQIYRIPMAFAVKPLDEDRGWGWSVTLPVTLGFFDFTTEDVLSGRFPDSVGTASLVPGARFDVHATGRWVLSPWVEAGAARELSSDLTRAVYATGLDSVETFPAGSWDGRAGQGVSWAGTGDAQEMLEDQYAQAEAGFEFRHELPWSSGRSRWNIGLFALYVRYFKERASSSAVAYAAPAGGKPSA